MTPFTPVMTTRAKMIESNTTALVVLYRCNSFSIECLNDDIGTAYAFWIFT